MRTVLLLALASAAWCQSPQPNVMNAQLETRPYSGSLEQQIQAERPTWFGYAVDAAARSGGWCQHGSPVLLDSSNTIAILFRVSNNKIEKIQVDSLACALDAGGQPFVWFTSVPQGASVAFLEKLVSSGAFTPNTDSAIFAISQHSSPRALDALVEMAGQNPSPHVREQALFWLAQRAGERAAATITNSIQNDPDGEVKKQAVFALSLLPKDEAVPKLIVVARTQRNPEVRKQAFFWLGQSHDPRALAFMEEVLMKQ